ncbi:MAG: PIN domain-containing protein [Candidatus Pacearchaeota archaeon]
MNKYYFDSYAIIEIIKGNPNYEIFKEETFVTSAINISEVYYYLINELGEQVAESVISKLNFEYLDIDYKTALKTSIFRHKNKKKKLSYIDCLEYNLAINHDLIFLTGDKEFEHLDKVKFVK